MSDERVIPTPAPADLPSFRIISDGQEVSPEYHIVSITVSRSVNKIPTARLMILDGDTSKEDFEISNSDDFVPGKEIEILAGYHSDETTMFKGIIISHSIKAHSAGPSLLVIECRDKAVKMTIGRKNAYYTEVTDSDVIEEIINEYGLEPDVESTETQHKEMVKYYTTDWDFIMLRAEVNGRLVIVDDGKVSVKSPNTDQEPALLLVYGSTMMEFEAEMDCRSQLAAAKGMSWDFSGQEIIEEESEEPQFNQHGNIESSTLSEVIGLDAFSMQHTGKVEDQELKSWADAKVTKSRLAKIIGRVKCQGFAEIKPGSMISLNGVGDRFNGSAYVTSVRHQINTKNWETDIQFGMPSKWFSQEQEVVDTPAAGLIPAVHGLQIGTVTQLQDDPDGEDRVLVRMPIISAEDDGIWARVASPDAGENRGIFFRPEIGDEVVLGFLNDDPRDPVIIGMLNSSAKPAPITASDDNHEKGIVTRGEMKVIFNDDEKSIKVETPNGNKITISDNDGSIIVEDENSNKLQMNSDGITVESSGDIKIKAGGDLTLEGTNVTVKADAQFKGEGSGGAEISSSATCTVKGSLVQIN